MFVQNKNISSAMLIQNKINCAANFGSFTGMVEGWFLAD